MLCDDVHNVRCSRVRTFSPTCRAERMYVILRIYPIQTLCELCACLATVFCSTLRVELMRARCQFSSADRENISGELHQHCKHKLISIHRFWFASASVRIKSDRCPANVGICEHVNTFARALSLSLCLSLCEPHTSIFSSSTQHIITSLAKGSNRGARHKHLCRKYRAKFSRYTPNHSPV